MSTVSNPQYKDIYKFIKDKSNGKGIGAADTNKNGKIDTGEFNTFFADCNVEKDIIAQFFKELNTDNFKSKNSLDANELEIVNKRINAMNAAEQEVSSIVNEYKGKVSSTLSGISPSLVSKWEEDFKRALNDDFEGSIDNIVNQIKNPDDTSAINTIVKNFFNGIKESKSKQIVSTVITDYYVAQIKSDSVLSEEEIKGDFEEYKTRYFKSHNIDPATCDIQKLVEALKEIWDLQQKYVNGEINEDDLNKGLDGTTSTEGAEGADKTEGAEVDTSTPAKASDKKIAKGKLEEYARDNKNWRRLAGIEKGSDLYKMIENEYPFLADIIKEALQQFVTLNIDTLTSDQVYKIKNKDAETLDGFFANFKTSEAYASVDAALSVIDVLTNESNQNYASLYDTIDRLVFNDTTAGSLHTSTNDIKDNMKDYLTDMDDPSRRQLLVNDVVTAILNDTPLYFTNYPESFELDMDAVKKLIANKIKENKNRFVVSDSIQNTSIKDIKDLYDSNKGTNASTAIKAAVEFLKQINEKYDQDVLNRFKQDYLSKQGIGTTPDEIGKFMRDNNWSVSKVDSFVTKAVETIEALEEEFGLKTKTITTDQRHVFDGLYANDLSVKDDEGKPKMDLKDFSVKTGETQTYYITPKDSNNNPIDINKCKFSATSSMPEYVSVDISNTGKLTITANKNFPTSQVAVTVTIEIDGVKYNQTISVKNEQTNGVINWNDIKDSSYTGKSTNNSSNTTKWTYGALSSGQWINLNASGDSGDGNGFSAIDGSDGGRKLPTATSSVGKACIKNMDLFIDDIASKLTAQGQYNIKAIKSAQDKTKALYSQAITQLFSAAISRGTQSGEGYETIKYDGKEYRAFQHSDTENGRNNHIKEANAANEASNSLGLCLFIDYKNCDEYKLIVDSAKVMQIFAEFYKEACAA